MQTDSRKSRQEGRTSSNDKGVKTEGDPEAKEIWKEKHLEQITASMAGEKKSWEYHYNYGGMDQKMIEQRKRRIALK